MPDSPMNGEKQLLDLSLMQLLSRWIIAPRATWSQLQAAAAAEQSAISIATPPERVDNEEPAVRTNKQWRLKFGTAQAQILLSLIALAFALAGSAIVRQKPRIDDLQLQSGAPLLLLGFLIWLLAELTGDWARMQNGWRACEPWQRSRWLARIFPAALFLGSILLFAQALGASASESMDLAIRALIVAAMAVLAWLGIEIGFHRRNRGNELVQIDDSPGFHFRRPSALRIWTIATAAIFSGVVWLNTSGNRIEPPTIALWLLSLPLWSLALSPARFNGFDWLAERIDSWRRRNWRKHGWALASLALVLLLGYSFRFHRLDELPAQMHSDLVEKIQDAYKIQHLDDYRIFMINNGGREPLHFYLLSLLASQPGMNFDHFALKLMSALESLLTLPLIFLLGLELAGRERRKFGILLGFIASALVAASFWHVVIGRQGMRISLAPLFTALASLYFIRGLRQNNRADYIKAGLALGFGLLSYQSMRLLPVAIVAGVGVAILIRGGTWRARLRAIVNLSVLAFIAMMVFLPLLHFWVEAPDSFMRRTSTRIFGDAPSSGDDRNAMLQESGATLLQNMRQAMLMFHYTADKVWVAAAPGEPAMDSYTAAFFTLGLAAWLARMLRARDPAYWYLTAVLVVMLMASALAIAFPREVPSFTRSSAAIIPCYLMAGLAAAQLCIRFRRALPKRLGIACAVIAIATLILSANQYNSRVYFEDFAESYNRSAKSQAEAGAVLRGFAQSDGAFGNAFIASSPHWYDHRAVGIEAGVFFWENTAVLADLPALIANAWQRANTYRLEPERDLLFFYAPFDLNSLPQLQAWFPDGRELRIDLQPQSHSFYTYRVPALGEAGLSAFLQANQ